MAKNTKGIAFIDIEIAVFSKKIADIGAVTEDGREFRSGSISRFAEFLRGFECVCGHNIIAHDLKYIKEIHQDGTLVIDTLHLSPLLFPKKPYHKLVKDDKLVSGELNNPLNDAKKARDLFFDEIAAFESLDENRKLIYFSLLRNAREFKDFFEYTSEMEPCNDIAHLIRKTFDGEICANANIYGTVKKYPVETAYATAQIGVIKYDSITPPWVLKKYPRVENILSFLRNRRCDAGCAWCNEKLDELRALKKYFDYDKFRAYENVPLQQEAAKAAIAGNSILAIFPTGGGKSITFQLPALMAGANEKGLTVVISPLQSLMKDQTDNLENQHSITEALTINGSLDPIERAKAFERVESGSASILYISPEGLRSKSIEALLLKRNVVRFVIDEAHCFSSWGHDFRVDYLYIGDFIKNLQQVKKMPQNIPVSCFTATAKQKVIADIKKYFHEKLNIDLQEFRTNAARSNLKYHLHLIEGEGEAQKYQRLRELLIDAECPVIIYVSRTKLAEKLAGRLTEDGYPAKAYHGQMDRKLRVENQDAFMTGMISIIVATTAFGMGVDKKDVGIVIHYDISDSLENYVQEAGRAGRDEKINADCYILFDDEDLNKHFIMLNQSKISVKEISQVWRALKKLTEKRASVSQSTLEIARKSGWDDSVSAIETRVKTAISALEQAGFIKRGQNMPKVFADSILVKNMEEARDKIDKSAMFDDKSREQAIRIIASLISSKSKTRGEAEEGEARVDHIADRLGIDKKDVISVIDLLRQEKILSDAKDLTAFFKRGERATGAKKTLIRHRDAEKLLLDIIVDEEHTYNIKEIFEAVEAVASEASLSILTTIINYYAIKQLVKRTKEHHKNFVTLRPYFSTNTLKEKSQKINRIAAGILDYLYARAATFVRSAASVADSSNNNIEDEDAIVEFSVLELKNEFENNLFGEKTQTADIEDALYYLSKIGALRVEGGFLVLYNSMQLERLEKDSKARYKKEHYAKLEEYYENKREQIHIVGEYAKKMLEDYNSALGFVDDYFVMDYDEFLHKHFKGRQTEIKRNITPAKFKQLFGELSPAQLGIINDHDSKYIVVAAGPGSGKTKLLTHKLASLYIMEDVKHEQMLMLTFSRAAATEFKKRLKTLIGGAANFIQITTFHSYCFELLGKVGDLEKSDTIIENTVSKINAGEVEISGITKTVIVIDEAQDMSLAEYNLVKKLIQHNDEARVIAVGDDDQNIYEFRGSSAKYFASLLERTDSKMYELVENYRSCANIVDFANQFAGGITERLKKTPIMPKRKNYGQIHVCKTAADNLVVPIVNMIQKEKLEGTVCVVARKNEDVLNIAALLNSKGIRARQIQSNNNFSLYNLVELRSFISDIDTAENSPVVTGDVWKTAKQNLVKNFDHSSDLPQVKNLIRVFDEINGKTIYKSDFKQFVRESNLDDFLQENPHKNNATMQVSPVLVSTIHQTKGMEFDNIFLATNSPPTNNADRRELYVAITRCKKNLYILHRGGIFDRINADNLTRIADAGKYGAPERLCLLLSHRDVALGFFAYRQAEISGLKSGQALKVGEAGLGACGKQVVKFSQKFGAQIESLKAKSYRLKTAKIRHIVFWQGKDSEKEIKIILPEVVMEKQA